MTQCNFVHWPNVDHCPNCFMPAGCCWTVTLVNRRRFHRFWTRFATIPSFANVGPMSVWKLGFPLRPCSFPSLNFNFPNLSSPFQSKYVKLFCKHSHTHSLTHSLTYFDAICIQVIFLNSQIIMVPRGMHTHFYIVWPGFESWPSYKLSFWCFTDRVNHQCVCCPWDGR